MPQILDSYVTVVYTNTTPAGAYRGYGATQAQFAIEIVMEEIRQKLNLDVIEFKRNNWIQIKEPMHMARKLGEGREGYDQAMATSALNECVEIGIKATDYYSKKEQFANQTGTKRKGIGMSVMIHGSGIAGLDMAAATLKMNADGSFNLLVGATDLGTGSDTILAQIAAEQIGVPVEDFMSILLILTSTPFD